MTVRLPRPPTLPRDVWRLELGALISTAGHGLALPFLLAYLDHRGLTLAQAGMTLTVLGVATLACTPLAGAAIDRAGAVAVLSTSLAVSAVGLAALSAANGLAPALACMTLIGLGQGAAWPAQIALLPKLVSGSQLDDAVAVHRIMLNGGYVIGGLVGGAVIAAGSLDLVPTILLIDSGTLLVYAAVSGRTHVPRAPSRRLSRRVGYRHLAADRTLVAVLIAIVPLDMIGYGLLTAVIGAYAIAETTSGAAGAGVGLAANAAACVVLQLPLSRRAAALADVQPLVLAAATWAVACLVALAASVDTLSSTASGATLAFACVLIGAGECLFIGRAIRLTTTLGGPEAEGRSVAALWFARQTGRLSAPVFGAICLAASPTVLWGASCVLVTAAAALLRSIAPAVSHRLSSDALASDD